MNKELRLYLLGRLQVFLDGEEITSQLPTKAQALLSYLVVNPRVHPRVFLATLLWGEKSDERAQRSLRVELVKMRDILSEVFLNTTRTIVEFDHNAPYTLDVEAFEQYIQINYSRSDDDLLERLSRGVALYRGEFLEGLVVNDAPGFEEWLGQQREQYHRLTLSALDKLVDLCARRGYVEEGIRYAQQLLQMERWDEKTHRQLMHLYARNHQKAAALTQYEICRKTLYDAFGIEPNEETKAMYQEVLAWPEPRLPERLPTFATPIPFQTPPAPAHFVGREHELRILRETLLPPHDENVRARLPRLAGVVGMGGAGKSSLTIQTAHELREFFPDGVLWTNAATSDPMDVAERWANAYDYDFSQLKDLKSRTEALRNVLAQKQVLLIFDDVTVAAKVRPFFPEGDQCAILFSTRNADLAESLGGKILFLGELPPHDGRKLLTTILGPERTVGQETAVTQICQLLHHLPLAVTIAAHYLLARTRRKLADFADRLQDETQRLNLQLQDREVRASFELSWQALDQTQQKIFRLLGVFQGRAFTAKSMAHIAEIDAFQAEDYLEGLTKWSLLGVEDEQRYRQHPLLADFANERLGENKTAYQRMVAYYLGYVQEHEQNYLALSPEWENLTASIRVATRERLWHDVLRYAHGLKSALFARGRYSEAREIYQQAYQATIAIEEEKEMANTLLQWGVACLEQNEHKEAQKLFSQSLQIYSELQELAGMATTLFHSARVDMEQARFDKALDHLSESGRLREQLDDLTGLAEITARQARIYYQKGAYETAQTLAEKAWQIQATDPSNGRSIPTLRLLSHTYLVLRDKAPSTLANEYMDKAETYAQKALELCETLHMKTELATTLLALAGVYRAQQQFDAALTQIEKSIPLLQRFGDRRSEAVAHYQMGRICREMGQFAEAVTASQKSLALSRSLNDQLGMAHTYLLLGDCLRDAQRGLEAIAAWEEAYRVAEKIPLQDLMTTLQKRLESQGG